MTKEKPRPGATGTRRRGGNFSDFASLPPTPAEIQEAAIARFEPPNQSRSTRDELRFGRKGSVSVCLITGQFYDFEHDLGGHVLSERYAGARKAVQRPVPSNQQQQTAKDRQAAADALWGRSRPIAGTAAERYLREARSITLDPLPNCLRFAIYGGHPALIVRAYDVETNDPCGVQVTRLTADGSGKIEDARRSRGRMKGAVVKLTLEEEVTNRLGICEGVEDGLSVLSDGWSPIWACLGTSGIRNFPVLPSVDVLTIFSDAGQGGQDAAGACAARWYAAGREVKIWSPPKGREDPNDAWQGADDV